MNSFAHLCSIRTFDVCAFYLEQHLRIAPHENLFNCFLWVPALPQARYQQPIFSGQWEKSNKATHIYLWQCLRLPTLLEPWMNMFLSSTNYHLRASQICTQCWSGVYQLLSLEEKTEDDRQPSESYILTLTLTLHLSFPIMESRE